MNEFQKSFLQSVLGLEGSAALLKATSKEPRLLAVLVPRVIVSWVEQHPEYEGSLPGVPNSFVQFSKSENGYQGCLALEDGMCKFEDFNIYRISAAIGLSIGYERHTPDTQVRDGILSRVGKSIDLLTKAQITAQNLAKARVHPVRLYTVGNFHIELVDGEGYSVIFTPTETPVQTDIKSFKEAEKVARYHHDYHPFPSKQAPAEVDKTEPTGTTAKPIPQEGPKGPIPPVAKQPKPLLVTKAESERVCGVCDKKQFKNGDFVGCLCLSDLSKSVKTLEKSNGYVLELGSDLTKEAVQTLIKILKEGL